MPMIAPCRALIRTRAAVQLGLRGRVGGVIVRGHGGAGISGCANSCATRRAAAKQDWANPIPDTENPSAFMAASMQGVIEKLRAQEKELARLHLLAQERAQESERLTEEVTRNMPTGCCW